MTLCFSIPDDPQFTEVVRQAEHAIENGVYPERIYQVGRDCSLSNESHFIRIS